jgi:hypothetical protein
VKQRTLTHEGILPLTELARFDLQMCTFLFALNFSVPPLQLLRFLQHKDVQRIWTAILERYCDYFYH